MFSSFLCFLCFFFLYVFFLVHCAFLSHLCDSPISLFMFSFFMFSFLYIVHFCRIIATALISELISHPFPSQKGVIRG